MKASHSLCSDNRIYRWPFTGLRSVSAPAYGQQLIDCRSESHFMPRCPFTRRTDTLVYIRNHSSSSFECGSGQTRVRGIAERTSGFSKWVLTLSSLHWLHHKLHPDTGSEATKYKCKPNRPATKYLRTWHGLCNSGSIMLKVPQRSTALARGRRFNHNSQ